MDRKYEVSINPRRTPFHPYTLDLFPALKEAEPLPKNSYADWAELSDALDRLGIGGDEKFGILYCLDRGDICRILGCHVSEEVAATFGFGIRT